MLSVQEGKGGKTEKIEDKPQKNEYLFKGLSLKIKPGTSNAIVGQSGFGKTTMINMIVSYLRFSLKLESYI